MLCKHPESWEKLIEDVVCSPALEEKRQALLQQCERHGEFRSLSADATFRCCFSLHGQTTYRAPKRLRTKQALPPQEAIHVLFTVRGKTGAVVVAEPLFWEGVDDIVPCVDGSLTRTQKEQVENWACDDPSRKLLIKLREILCNLKAMSLDPSHLVITYEKAQWGKRTQGSQVLRCIMAKFGATEGARVEGPIYNADRALEATANEARAMTLLQGGSMSKDEAERVIGALDGSTPFVNRAGFVEALAALVALYPNEVSKQTASGTTLKHKLVCAAAPANVEWLLNDTRFRQELTAEEVELNPTGSASNEALHAEVNRWLDGIHELHQPVLKLKVRCFQMVKLLTHNSALYSPTTVQIPQHVLIARIVGSMAPWDQNGWAQWAGLLLPQEADMPRLKADLPLATDRARIAMACKVWRTNGGSKNILKRPASVLPKQARSMKRTPFRLDKGKKVVNDTASKAMKAARSTRKACLVK